MSTANPTKTAAAPLKSTAPDIDLLCIDTIRTLSMDAVQAADSGHPGTPMALAPVAYSIWQHFLRYDPADPTWFNRDRFVLSNGHASMLLYSIIHLASIKEVNREGKILDQLALTVDDLKKFREYESRCPGHPEYRWTTGVETTTGPLGQGVATSVGMAIASRWLAAHYNKPGFELFDYDLYVLCGDGDMMEGISHEAASTAGHLKLSNLCWIYDNNHITIEGNTSIAFTEDVGARFKAYGWHVEHVTDANDLTMLGAAFKKFKATTDKPTFIIVDSHIGWGAPHKQDTASAHGEALGDEEIRLTKKFYGWPEDAKFLVPAGVVENFTAHVGKRGSEARAAWEKKFAEYRKQFPELAKQIDHIKAGTLPEGWDKDLKPFPADAKGMASRESGGKALNMIAKNLPWVCGGSADLAPSTKTLLTFEGTGNFQPGSYGGRNFHFGVREHAMCAIVNGMALCGLRSYGASFFIFTDYAKGAIRISAVMESPSIFVMTHDSIGLGQDGPTHQPVEQLATFRAMPGISLIRPGDANETLEAWRIAIQHADRPTILVLSRQNLPTLDRTKFGSASGVAKGAYVLADAAGGKPDVILIGTGSSVPICVTAYERLTAAGIKARVVSMPSWDLFEKQTQAYRDEVLPPTVLARVAIEEAATFGWSQWVGPSGAVLGMKTFGLSAPIKDIYKHFGFTPENLEKVAKEQIAAHKK
ncbi:MAG TPA: transketolase [Gemmataceae bacterium]|jgi:transketolase|nr:transketolase [Gemmataceae bacterium]